MQLKNIPRTPVDTRGYCLAQNLVSRAETIYRIPPRLSITTYLYTYLYTDPIDYPSPSLSFRDRLYTNPLSVAALALAVSDSAVSSSRTSSAVIVNVTVNARQRCARVCACLSFSPTSALVYTYMHT